jgi:hypothetical protein
MSVFGPKSPIKRMSDFRKSWLGSGPAENHPMRKFKLRHYLVTQRVALVLTEK